MKDADVSKINLEEINKAVNKKIYTIYENYNLVGANVSKAILARGTDGKYILVYDCLVDIANANTAEIYTNRTKIIVEIN